jgi:hypothetical protein
MPDTIVVFLAFGVRAAHRHVTPSALVSIDCAAALSASSPFDACTLVPSRFPSRNAYLLDSDPFMDPLSITASIIAILKLSGEVLTYINDVEDASQDRARCAIEASNLHSLLFNLRFHLEKGILDQSWYTAVRALAVKNGPLDQFKEALEMLQTRMTDRGRLGKFGRALTWSFKKEEMTCIFTRIERLKSLIEIALHMDHL